MSPPSSHVAVKYGLCLLTLKKKRIQVFETKCLWKLLRIFYSEHKTNGWVRSKINFLVGPQEPLLATVKRRKLAWFGHVTHVVATASPKPSFRAPRGGRRRGWQRKYWMDNIKMCTSLPMPELFTKAFYRKGWKRICAESSLMSSLRPNMQRD